MRKVERTGEELSSLRCKDAQRAWMVRYWKILVALTGMPSRWARAAMRKMSSESGTEFEDAVRQC